ncbi:MAG: protein-glutamate O-methyltransferase CheR [Pseudomonadota bacterium]
MIKITPSEFNIFSRYIYDLTGILLDESKAYLVETRLAGLLEDCNCSSFSELHYKIKSGQDSALQVKIINAITTNEIFFFRDVTPFELLRHKILPDLIDKRTKAASKFSPVNIRIWSAACSTGQEVYSIAMTIKELLPDLRNYNVRILGTDLSDAALTRASYGRYTKFEIERGLPPGQLQRFFNPNGGEHWNIRDEIRAMAVFKRYNLMHPLNALGRFDIVFCRNVAIYFSREDRTNLFNRIAAVMEPDGYLIVGASEILSDLPRFEAKRYLRGIFYQLK